MFKKLRIKHEGYHRMAIILSLLLIPFPVWFVFGVQVSTIFVVPYSVYNVYLNYYYFVLEFFTFLPTDNPITEKIGYLLLLIGIHIVFFCLFYALAKAIVWMIHGFKK